MRKRSASHDLAAFPSPGAPQYRGSTAGFQKSWASERVRARQIGPASAAATTFSSRRAVPSKWEDAERWICSPLNINNNAKTLGPQQQPRKRPKSKSGPILQTTAAAVEGGSLRSFAAGSPFSAGVLAVETVCGAGVGTMGGLPGIVPDWPEFKDNNHCCPSPKISSPSESNEKSEESLAYLAVSQRDMATQMSPRDCRCSHSIAASPAALLPITEQQIDGHFASLEVRDVQVDKRATTIWQSRKRGIRMAKRGQLDVTEFGENAYDISEAAMDNSKWERVEAKITAWENLQKAKAEAAMRRLEMKLEKERSATMDKIVDKLRAAEFKAREMRSKLSDDPLQPPRMPHKLFIFRKQVWVGSLGRIFRCCAV